MAIGRRLGFGLLKGLGLGLALGAVFHFGLGWRTTAGLLAYLLAMGAGATAGAVLGKAPWAQSGWLETSLRVLGGLLLGALVTFLGEGFASFALPFGVLGAPSETLWHELPLLYSALVAGLYGAMLGAEGESSGSTDTAVAS